MSQSRYWIEAMQMIDDKANMEKYESRVPMALHNAKIHRPSVYISAKVNYAKMLEFEELAGRIPRSNLPFTWPRNKREPFYSQAAVKTSSFKVAPKLDGSTLDDMTERSLVCSRCKLSAMENTAFKETAKSTTKKTAKRRLPKAKKKAPCTSKPEPGVRTEEHDGQKRGKYLQSEKAVSSGTSMPNPRQTWRVSEKTNSNVNRLISLLHAIDDLPRKKSYSARQKIGYQQPPEPKRRAKLSKPGRMANAGEFFFLQAGELSLRNFLVKEDEVLSGLLQVSSKRPTPQHTAMGKNASSVGTPVRGCTAAEQSEAGELRCDKASQSTVRGSITTRKDLKASSRCNTDAPHQGKANSEGRADHRNHQGQMLRLPMGEGIETSNQDSLPPLYISHHSTTCFPPKQNPAKPAQGASTKDCKRKSKDNLQRSSSFLRDPRKVNSESTATERRCSVPKGGLPPIVIPRVTTPLRGYTPWTDVTSSPCMLNPTLDDAMDNE